MIHHHTILVFTFGVITKCDRNAFVLNKQFESGSVSAKPYSHHKNSHLKMGSDHTRKFGL